MVSIWTRSFLMALKWHQNTDCPKNQHLLSELNKSRQLCVTLNLHTKQQIPTILKNSEDLSDKGLSHISTSIRSIICFTEYVRQTDITDWLLSLISLMILAEKFFVMLSKMSICFFMELFSPITFFFTARECGNYQKQEVLPSQPMTLHHVSRYGMSCHWSYAAPAVRFLFFCRASITWNILIQVFHFAFWLNINHINYFSKMDIFVLNWNKNV